jgi:hypothetical protein
MSQKQKFTYIFKSIEESQQSQYEKSILSQLLSIMLVLIPDGLNLEKYPF